MEEPIVDSVPLLKELQAEAYHPWLQLISVKDSGQKGKRCQIGGP